MKFRSLGEHNAHAARAEQYDVLSSILYLVPTGGGDVGYRARPWVSGHDRDRGALPASALGPTESRGRVEIDLDGDERLLIDGRCFWILGPESEPRVRSLGMLDQLVATCTSMRRCGIGESLPNVIEQLVAEGLIS